MAIRHRVSVVLVVLIGIVAGLAAISAPPAAATTYASQAQANAGMYWCTSTASLCTKPFATMSNGTAVHMVCWRDDRTATVVYSSNRWFYVQLPNGQEGFVHSSAVKKQTTVGNCSSNREVAAALWATAENGSTAYGADGCLQFVLDAYADSTGYNIGGPYNSTAYLWAKAHKLVTTGTPPVGALVFWGKTSGNADGHVVISLGNGYAMSTNEETTYPVHLMNIKARTKAGYPYMGYLNE